MTTKDAEFEQRANEIESYFRFLVLLGKEHTAIHSTDENGAPHTEAIGSDLLKLLKAAGFLLLYNLVESTMRNGIDSIYNTLEEKQVRFDDARQELKDIALANIKSNGTADLWTKIKSAEVDLLTCAFDKQKLFSGNVDARKIRDSAKQYGFRSATGRAAHGGRRLLPVKTNRNDLSHGNKSFSEVGREHTVEDMVEIKKEVVEYLAEVTRNIGEYIARGDFLAAADDS